MQYLIAKKGGSVQHFSDTHKMGLFEEEDTLKIMNEVGFKSKHIEDIDGFRLGLYIGIKE